MRLWFSSRWERKTCTEPNRSMTQNHFSRPPVIFSTNISAKTNRARPNSCSDARYASMTLADRVNTKGIFALALEVANRSLPCSCLQTSYGCTTLTSQNSHELAIFQKEPLHLNPITELPSTITIESTYFISSCQKERT